MAARLPKGVIFDLDGVITDTARIHGLAWESMFNDFLQAWAEKHNQPFVPFDRDSDYLEYVDGKPRMKGVESFLASRGIELPFGDHKDSPQKETVCGLGNRKNKDFQKVLKEKGPDIFTTSVDFIKACRKRGIRIGIASSSANCKLILQLAKLESLFETRVDGEVSLKLGLSGKPDPDIFVTAAHNLGLHPHDCVVVEDAISGVQAGRNGNFGLTLGIARSLEAEALIRHGADLAVNDLAEITLDEIEHWFTESLPQDGWTLTYRYFDPNEESLRETLTAVGNGYLGNRGSFEGASADQTHYPGTYLAGVYNKLATKVGGKSIDNNDFVNCPNWSLLEFAVGKGSYLNPIHMTIASYRHSLDMQSGEMSRLMVVTDARGRTTRVAAKRIASMHNPHLLAQSFEVTPLNYSGEIRIRSALDGRIINDNVHRYRELKQKHLVPVAQGKAGSGVYLQVQTSRSKYQILMAAHTSAASDCKPHSRVLLEKSAYVGEELTFRAEENRPIRVEKQVAVVTSLDQPGTETSLLARARKLLAVETGYTRTLEKSARAWKRLWEKADITIEGDRFMQKVARLHTYHLMISASPHNKTIDAGITARGLHGEAYRGHVFWDELYILPFYNQRFPEISKALLMYRYRRLDAARRYARENGYRGAMYPWQTADGGDEETQQVHYNPADGSWGPDLSRRQRHVSIAVFYNVWRYVRDSGDSAFLTTCGAEIMLEIARFWASIAAWDENTGRYAISGVMGPDEFHEKLPGSDQPGLKDNAYTNIMVVWLLDQALNLLEILPAAGRKKLSAKIDLSPDETSRWKDIGDKLGVQITGKGVISQFDGYMELDELDWEHYRNTYGDIHRLDRLLKAEGDSPDHYKLAKQADTLMTYYLLSPQEVADILGQLGYRVDDPVKMLQRNYDYYQARTSHGSTLSKVVHAVICSHLGNEKTVWAWFTEAMQSDIHDTQGGTTHEGIHCGVMAGTLDLITRYFAGIDLSGELISINPNLPPHWRRLSLTITHRKTSWKLEFTRDKITINASKNAGRQTLLARGKSKTLQGGKTLAVSIK